MADELRGKRIAALVENGFEQSELLEPKKALEQAGAKVDIVSPQTIAGERLAAHRLGSNGDRGSSARSGAAPTSTTRCCCRAAW